MVMHTFQTAAAYEELLASGVLDGERDHWEQHFVDAYDWMQTEMAQRLPTAGDGIVWLWAATTRRELLAEARRSRRDVLLTVQMPREHVLLSDFNTWHCVLNSTLLIAADPTTPYPEWTRRHDVAWDEWSDRTHAYVNAPISAWPSAERRELEASWRAIFDPATWFDSHDGHTWRPTQHIQATAHRITVDEVIRAVRIL